MSVISTQEDTRRAAEGGRSAPASAQPSLPAHAPRHARTAKGRLARSKKRPSGPVPSRTSRAHARRPLHRESLLWALLVIVILLGASVPVVASVGTTVDRQAPRQKVTVTYSVTGSGTSSVSSINYQTTTGGGTRSGKVQETDAPLPWTRTVVTSGLSTLFFVRVENGSVGLSSVICSISENGTVLSSNQAEGPYAVASCSARTPVRS